MCKQLLPERVDFVRAYVKSTLHFIRAYIRVQIGLKNVVWPIYVISWQLYISSNQYKYDVTSSTSRRHVNNH